MSLEKLSLRERGGKVMAKKEEEEEEEEEEVEKEREKVGWAEMLPETLVEVFKRLTIKELMTIVPQVCKAWKKCSYDPGCWQIVNLKRWITEHPRKGLIDEAVKLAVERSGCSMQELYVSYLENDACLNYLARSGVCALKTLCIPDSNVTDDGMCELAQNLPALSHLDISRCNFLSRKSLEVIGQKCRSLTRLNRSLYAHSSASIEPVDDSEALAIAQYMPKLKHLEMQSGLLSNSGLLAILDMCPDLEYLNVRHCWHVRSSDAAIEERRSSKLRDFHRSADDSDYEDDSDDDEVDDWDYTTELWGDFDYLEDYIDDDIF